MTDYTTADDFTTALMEAEPDFAGAFHGDFYEVIRMVPTKDGRGGDTTTETTAETGRCALIPARDQSREGLSGNLVQSIYSMTVELPVVTTAKADDVIEINGVRYQIVAITVPGNHDIFPMANLERAT